MLAYHATSSPASPSLSANIVGLDGGGGDAAGGAAGHRQGEAGLLQQRRDFRVPRMAGFGVFDVMTQACCSHVWTLSAGGPFASTSALTALPDCLSCPKSEVAGRRRRNCVRFRGLPEAPAAGA